jgi:aryl-alcohol dehydrogenase-like predicted oxidoreductase
VGEGPNDGGISRYHLIRSCERSLRRLRTDRIDLYQLHEWDGETPLEEALEALDTLVRSGKVRYVGASNYSGWHLMKSLATAERHGYVRFVSQQIHYSLQSRDAEYELVPISIDQGLGILVWSPLAGGFLSGKYRRAPEGSRHLAGWGEPPIYNEDQLYNIIVSAPVLLYPYWHQAKTATRKTYIRNRSDGAVKTSLILLKPASWPSSCHREAVSGMSDAWTCAVIASHSSIV